MTEHLTEHEINNLVERLRQHPEMRVAILECRIAKARDILTARIPQSQLAEAITRAVEALEGE